ncbi:MAG: hybrid sensor histidine kinase/response regulator [Vicinamibacterales bacterium]
MDSRLARSVVIPFATIGVLAALLVWEIEHVGSIVFALALAAAALAASIVVLRRFRTQLDELAGHYESLLRIAADESRRAEEAVRIKDEFLGMLSHELRTPLNSVLGWSRLLASGKLDQGQSERAVQAIERAGWAQLRLIEDLLDLSRILAGRLQISTKATRIQPIVHFVMQSLEPASLAKRIRIDAAIDPSIGALTIDPDRVQQIVWHLLSNAIKFTPAGGRVSVTLDRDGDQVRLAVADSGIGFDPDVSPVLFERFRQADSSSTRPYRGLGLGLGIVRHLVELHGGTVSARSGGPDQGATFEVHLPMRAAIEPEPTREHEIESGPALEGVSVLVVDDDAGALDYARSSLERFGAVVFTARNAREALQRVQYNSPDVLLSDLRMPDEDGLQLIRDVRRIDRERGRITPAAALTALARTADRQLALGAGFQMHVTKPIEPKELAAAVEQLVGGVNGPCKT